MSVTWILPSLPFMFAVFGNSNMFQKSLTHGPAPITTCSQSIVPLLVYTPVTALLLLPLLKPFTLTPLCTFTPLEFALLSKALIESLLNA